MVLGIDIGGTAIKAGLVNANGNIAAKLQIEVTELRIGNFITNFTNWLKPVINENGITAVGVGVPGLVSANSDFISVAPNIPEIEGGNFIKALQKSFPWVTFRFANDANAAACGTYLFCNEKKLQTFGYITLGTGIGSAVILNGKLYTGQNGNGPELGMLQVFGDKIVEDVCAKDGIIRIASEIYGQKSNESTLGGLSTFDIYNAAQTGDSRAIEVFNQAGILLGESLCLFIQLFDISTIYIGGGIAPAYEFMEKSVNEVIHARLSAYYFDNLSIKPTSLGNDAGILGAAALIDTI